MPLTEGGFGENTEKSDKKRPAPYSLRLSEDQRERLTVEAAGDPLGTYIKAKLFGTAPIRRHGPSLKVEDRELLARALALLGRSRIASNLNQLAHAANIGSLPITPETQAELLACLRDVRDIRRLLMIALGLKPEAE